MHRGFVYESHKQISTSCVHQFVEIKDYGSQCEVLHPSWLWRHSSDHKAGLKHLTVLGRYDTTGPLADPFDYMLTKEVSLWQIYSCYSTKIEY